MCAKKHTPFLDTYSTNTLVKLDLISIIKLFCVCSLFMDFLGHLKFTILKGGWNWVSLNFRYHQKNFFICVHI